MTNKKIKKFIALHTKAYNEVKMIYHIGNQVINYFRIAFTAHFATLFIDFIITFKRGLNVPVQVIRKEFKIINSTNKF